MAGSKSLPTAEQEEARARQLKKRRALLQKQEQCLPQRARAASDLDGSLPAVGVTRSASMPARVVVRKAKDDGDQVFAAMVKRHAQMRKEVLRPAPTKRLASPGGSRAGSKVVPRDEESEEENIFHPQEKAAELINAMASAMAERERRRHRRAKRHGETHVKDPWPSLVQQAAVTASAAVAMLSAATDVQGDGVNSRSTRKERDDRRKSKEEELLKTPGPWEALVQQHRRARAMKERAEQEAAARAREETSEDESYDENDLMPETPSHPPPCKEQPAPPPMPPYWNEFKWRDRRRTSAEERAFEQERLHQEQQSQHRQQQRQQQRRHMQPMTPPKQSKQRVPQPEEPEGKGSASDASPHGAPHDWRRLLRCPLFPNLSWGKVPSEQPRQRPTSEAPPKQNSKQEREMPQQHHRAWKQDPQPSPNRPWAGWPWSRSSSKVAQACDDEEEVFEEQQEEVFEEQQPPLETPGALHVPLDPRASDLIAEVEKQLQQSRNYPLQDRRRVFRELQRQMHPDKNPEEEEAAKLAFQYLMDSRVIYLRP